MNFDDVLGGIIGGLDAYIGIKEEEQDEKKAEKERQRDKAERSAADKKKFEEERRQQQILRQDRLNFENSEEMIAAQQAASKREREAKLAYQKALSDLKNEAALELAEEKRSRGFGVPVPKQEKKPGFTPNQLLGVVEEGNARLLKDDPAAVLQAASEGTDSVINLLRDNPRQRRQNTAAPTPQGEEIKQKPNWLTGGGIMPPFGTGAPTVTREDLPRPQSKEEFDRLPSGTQYIDPEGNVRTKR